MELATLLLVVLAICVNEIRMEADCDLRACYDSYKTLVQGGNASPESICRELQNSNACLQKQVDACANSDHWSGQLETELEQLGLKISRECGSGDGDEIGNRDVKTVVEELEECLKGQEEYILRGCTSEEFIEDIANDNRESGMTDQKISECIIVNMMVQCFEERTEEKCGVENSLTIARLLQEEIGQQFQDECNQLMGR